MAECVLVTDKEFAKGKAVFKSAGGFNVKSAPKKEQALTEAILAHNCRAVVIGVDSYTGLLYEALGKTGGDKGAIIARYGVGHDGVDKQLAREHNIIVTNTPGVLDISVAEHTIWLMGALARNIVRMDARMREGEFGSLTGMELRGKMLVIVGFGAIGRHVAKIAHFGLGMRVFSLDVLSPREISAGLRKSLDEIKAEYGLEAYTNDVNGVLRRADVVSVHLPDVPQTRHFFNAERLAVMKPEAILINTARGPVVDERALYEALSSGQLAGAALDVFEQEPYVPVDTDKDLRKLENIVITPHIASNTRETNSRMATLCMENIQAFFAGRMKQLSGLNLCHK